MREFYLPIHHTRNQAEESVVMYLTEPNLRNKFVDFISFVNVYFGSCDSSREKQTFIPTRLCFFFECLKQNLTPINNERTTSSRSLSPHTFWWTLVCLLSDCLSNRHLESSEHINRPIRIDHFYLSGYSKSETEERESSVTIKEVSPTEIETIEFMFS